jgi:hypothetical protein
LILGESLCSRAWIMEATLWGSNWALSSASAERSSSSNMKGTPSARSIARSSTDCDLFFGHS